MWVKALQEIKRHIHVLPMWFSSSLIRVGRLHNHSSIRVYAFCPLNLLFRIWSETKQIQLSPCVFGSEKPNVFAYATWYLIAIINILVPRLSSPSIHLPTQTIAWQLIPALYLGTVGVGLGMVVVVFPRQERLLALYTKQTGCGWVEVESWYPQTKLTSGHSLLSRYILLNASC